MAILTSGEILHVDEDHGTPSGADDEGVSNSTKLNLLLSGIASQTADATDDFTTPQVAVETDFFDFSQAEGITSIGLVGPDGAYSATDGVDSGLTLSSTGETIYLYAGADSDSVYGRVGGPSGDIVLVIYLEETGTPSAPAASLWIVQYAAITHDDTATAEPDYQTLADKVFVATVTETGGVASDFSDVPAGAPIFAMIAPDDPADEIHFLATAYNTNAPETPITVNVSNQGSFPGSLASGSQNMTPGTSMRFDLVVDGDVTYSQSEGKTEAATVFSDHADVTSAGFTVVQNQGGRPTDLRVVAYDVDDSLDNLDQSDFYDSFDDQTQVSIDSVTVYTINPTTGQPVGASVTYAAGDTGGGKLIWTNSGTAMDPIWSVTVKDALLNTTITINASDGFDRFTVSNVDSQKNAYVDIGRLTYGTVSTSEDKLEIGSLIQLDDSGPTVTGGASPTSGLQTSDVDFSVDDTADFSGLFTKVYGADGPDDTTPVDYDLSTAGVATGLTSDGVAITLAKVGDTIVGSAGMATIFVISVDSAGVVTLDQQGPIDHLDGSLNESDLAEVLGGTNNVVLTATVEDADHDTDDASVDITASISFLDDHPTVTAGGTLPTLDVEDELLGAAGSDTADFSSFFTVDYGNDGEGDATTYQLGIGAGSTGLFACAYPEDEIVLSMDGDDVIGTADGNEVFRVSVDSDGKVTLTQSLAMEHPLANETLSLTANLVTLTATASDGDKDTGSDTLDIGDTLVFGDAQPEFTDEAADLNVRFENGASKSDTIAVDYHNDEPGTLRIVDGGSLDNYDGPFNWDVNDDGTRIDFTDDNGTLIYHVDLTSTGYTVTVDNAPDPEPVPLNFNAIKAGGPQETLTAPLTDGTDSIVFNGVINGVEPAPSNTDDLLNPDSLGFGLKGGQASQINPGEGFTFETASGEELNALTFDVQGIGNIKTVTANWTLYDDDHTTIIDSGSQVLNLGSGNSLTEVSIDEGVAYDYAVVTFTFPTAEANQGIRVLDFEVIVDDPAAPDDFEFDLLATDCDGDTVGLTGVSVALDPTFAA